MLGPCELLLGSNLYIENTQNEINSIAFTQLLIIHSLVITLPDFIESFKCISQSPHTRTRSFKKNPSIYRINEFKAYQIYPIITFVFNILLVDSTKYNYIHHQCKKSLSYSTSYR